MEEESSGEQMLPISFLRQLISMYGNSMQSLMPHYLEASMDNFRANQAKLHEAFVEACRRQPRWRKIAETNMAMFKAAADALHAGARQRRAAARRADRADELGDAARADGGDAEEARRAGQIVPAIGLASPPPRR